MKYIILILLNLNLYSYKAKIIFVDNNFKNLRENKIEKIIYLTSEISFDIKKGMIFNLYRNIEDDLNKKSSKSIDLNKKVKNKTSIYSMNNKEIKKVCILKLKVISRVENLIKAIEFKKCSKNYNNQVLGEFQYSKIGDFIEIKTIFDKKEQKIISNKGIYDIIASLYMIGIDDDFNYLLESGIKELHKPNDLKKNTVDSVKDENGENNKKLPRKKLKKKKRKKRVPNFEKIRL